MIKNGAEMCISGVSVKDLPPSYRGNPRRTGLLLGTPVVILGQGTQPDAVGYPGWKISQGILQSSREVEVCLFSVEQGTATPAGIVRPRRNPERPDKIQEFAVEGSGTLLIATPNDTVLTMPVSAASPREIGYGPGVRVAYFANEGEIFVGANVTPNDITEDTLAHGSNKAPKPFWAKYEYLLSHMQSTS